MKKLLVLLVLLGVVFAAGASWFSHTWRGSDGAQEYILAPMEWGTISETVSASGVLEPNEEIAVGSELSGRVVEIYPAAHVNGVVRPDEPLLKLDDRMAREKLEQARSAVRLAEADLARAMAQREVAGVDLSWQLDLHQKQLVSNYAVEKARSGVRAAEAAVQTAHSKIDEARAAQKLAQLGIDLTVVRVPAGGRQYTIIDRHVVLGQLVAAPASARLFTLTNDLSRLQARVQVSENDIGKIRVGQQVTFTVYAYSEADARFQGKVTEIRPLPTNVHGAVFYDTIVDLANDRDPGSHEWKLRPGMTAAVDFILRQHTAVWKAPVAAFNFQPDEHHKTEAARARLARWQSTDHQGDWKPLWILDRDGKPRPVFVRVGSKDAAGEAGLADSQFREVLEFDPELGRQPNPQDPSTSLRVITGVLPVDNRGFFDRAKVKIF